MRLLVAEITVGLFSSGSFEKSIIQAMFVASSLLARGLDPGKRETSTRIPALLQRYRIRPAFIEDAEAVAQVW